MLKGGVILLVASLLGFVSNFIFSIYLEKDSYGELVSMFSVTSILVLVFPLGTNSYFLSDSKLYKKYSNTIVFFPIILSFFFGLIVLIYDFSFKMLAFLSLLLTGCLSVQGVMDSQIGKSSQKSAVFQSLQPVAKFIPSLVVLVFYYFPFGEFNYIDLVYVSLVVSFLIVFPFSSIFLYDKESKLLDLSFFKHLSSESRRKIVFFWFSSIIGMVCSLGIVPLVSYFYNMEYVAYLGVYFIFWSGVNILITATINNYFWPKVFSVSVEDKVKTLSRSMFFSVFLFFAIILGVIVFAEFFSKNIWRNYKEINVFLCFSAVALGLRVLSAWVGMMLLSNKFYIERKLYSQVVVIISMAILVLLFNIKNVTDLSFFLIIIEVVYFLGYLVFSIDIIKNKKYLVNM